MAVSKITVLIVEDDPIIASDLRYHMEDFGYSPYPAVSNGSDALLLLNNVVPDFILIDVSLEGDMDGIELAEKINETRDLPIIFLTAHHDRATMDRIMATQPDAYLVKPIQVHTLKAGIELALYNHANRKLTNAPPENPEEEYISGKHFFIKVKNQLQKILLDDIRVMEAYDNYSFVHTSDQKHIIGSTLKTLEQKLGAHPFIRIHRSYIINLEAISRIEDDIVFIDSFKIPIGKTYKEEFMKRINLL